MQVDEKSCETLQLGSTLNKKSTSNTNKGGRSKVRQVWPSSAAIRNDVHWQSKRCARSPAYGHASDCVWTESGTRGKHCSKRKLIKDEARSYNLIQILLRHILDRWSTRALLLRRHAHTPTRRPIACTLRRMARHRIDFPFYIIDLSSIYSQNMIAAYSVPFFNKYNKSLIIYLPIKGCR
jgi:hypothetical protein